MPGVPRGRRAVLEILRGSATPACADGSTDEPPIGAMSPAMAEDFACSHI
jgi:hypothetical protein